MAIRVVANGPNGHAFFGWLEIDLDGLTTSPKDPPIRIRKEEEGFNNPHCASPGFVFLRIKSGSYEIRTWWAEGIEAALTLNAGESILFLDVESITKLSDNLIAQGAYAGHRAKPLSQIVELEPLDIAVGQITPAMLQLIKASTPRPIGLAG